MGIMLFSLILTTATAPRIMFETRREKEEEMLWRGQQVAFAISRYSQVNGGRYPTKLIDLVTGVDLGTKKTRFLRKSALCDPMTPCEPDAKTGTNWRPVYPGDPLVKELLEAYLATLQKEKIGLPGAPASLVMFAQMSGAKLGLDGQGSNDASGLSSGLGFNSGQTPTHLPGQPVGQGSGMVSGGMFSGNGSGLSSGSMGGSMDGSDSSGISSQSAFGDKDSRPIIGVVSKKSEKMFRSYFGIEYYDHTLFFPTVPVVAGGFASPLTQQTISSNSGPSAQCNGGGVVINGKCWGGLTPGILCRGPGGTTIPCSK